jgi:hypothetical protein
MKLFYAISLTSMLALGGCATIPNPISKTAAYGVVAAYGAAQQAALTYDRLPTCAAGTHFSATNPCSEHSVKVQIANADAKAQIARRALEAFVRNPANYPGLTYAGLLAAFNDARTAFSQIVATTGVSS